MDSHDLEKTARQKLFTLITTEKNLVNILNLGEQLLNTPISYTNILTNHQEFSKGFQGELPSKSPLNNKHFNIGEYHMNFLAHLDRVTASTPFITKINADFNVLVSKVYYSGNYLGYLYIPESEISLSSLNHEIIKQIGHSCAIVDLLRNSMTPLAKSSHNEHMIFEELLDRKYKTIADFNYVSTNYSFKKYTQFYILCITLASTDYGPIEEQIVRRSENYNIGVWYKIQANNIVVMIGLNQGSIGIFDLTTELKKAIKSKNVEIGISDPFTHILATHDHFKHAESALFNAKKSNSPKMIHLYDDYKFKTFLKDVNPFIPSANNYISYKIMDILHYDLNNKTDYANTLKTYLSASLSPQVTSEILFIHKNTVIYRINKMKELFNIDFSDADQCFQLYFSFQLLITRGWEKKP